MRGFVTGGSGFIGSHLVDALIERGHFVTVLDDLSTGSLDNLDMASRTGRMEFVEGTTSDAELVEELVSESDFCFHLASAVGVELIVEQGVSSLLRNVHGAENVLSAAARHDVRVVYASTSEIYGKDSQGSLDENSDRLLGPPQLSRWAYAISKEFGESLAFGLHKEEGAETIVVRFFNTTGPRQTGKYGMVVPRFVGQALTGQTVTVYGDGVQSRCFAHVQDTVDALLTLLERDDAIGRAFNIGSEHEVPIVELARTVIERSHSSSQIEFIPFADAYGEGFEELGRRKPDTTALRELTGWEPTLTLDDVIDDTVDYQQWVGGMPAVVNGRRFGSRSRWNAATREERLVLQRHAANGSRSLNGVPQPALRTA